METPPDLSTKYQRLATEYSKMRAQLTVLKKGVIDEQTKGRELKDELQAKEQSIRKLEQEMDSLYFRNTQLEKRVGFLQDELSLASQKMAKGKSKLGFPPHFSALPPPSDSAPLPSSNNSPLIFDNELLVKIEENINLQKKISEMEESHRRELMELRAQMQSVHPGSPSRDHQEQLDTLEAEKLSLTYSLQNNLDEIEAYKEQTAQLTEKIRLLTAVTAPSNLAQLSQASNMSVELPEEPSNPFLGDAQVNEITSPCENLPHDNRSLEERLTTAEQQREHWTLEYQLLKMKYSKIYMKLEEAREILKTFGKDDLISGEITPSVENVQSFTSMVGKIEVLSDDPASWGKAHEKETKEFLIARINQLVSLLQGADSKAITFYNECKSIANQLRIAVDRRNESESNVETLMLRQSALQEELQLTKDNYETQLSTMSDHLANMNEKLAVQKDTIDELRYSLNAKGSSSGKKK